MVYQSGDLFWVVGRTGCLAAQNTQIRHGNSVLLAFADQRLIISLGYAGPSHHQTYQALAAHTVFPVVPPPTAQQHFNAQFYPLNFAPTATLNCAHLPPQFHTRSKRISPITPSFDIL
jgi:hypothetical protein